MIDAMLNYDGCDMKCLMLCKIMIDAIWNDRCDTKYRCYVKLWSMRYEIMIDAIWNDRCYVKLWSMRYKKFDVMLNYDRCDMEWSMFCELWFCGRSNFIHYASEYRAYKPQTTSDVLYKAVSIINAYTLIFHDGNIKFNNKSRTHTLFK